MIEIDRFENGEGRGRYGGLCTGRSLSLNGFRASKSGAVWIIDALP